MYANLTQLSRQLRRILKEILSEMASSSTCVATVVVPAYKEQPNLRPLVERLSAACTKAKLAVEIVVVDDNSQDGSRETVEALAAEGFPCRIIVRTRERGLSSAVMRGFDEAKGLVLVCMDGDLQHPPESVPSLIRAVQEGRHEFAIGTRYAGKELSVDRDWPMHRRLISWGARLLARPLSSLSDPMTGFFALSRTAWHRGRSSVSAQGFKICLESFIKCGCGPAAEIPILFGARVHGESKLDSKVIVSYLVHLVQLYRFKFGPLLLLLCLLVVLFFFFKLFGLL